MTKKATATKPQTVTLSLDDETKATLDDLKTQMRNKAPWCNPSNQDAMKYAIMLAKKETVGKAEKPSTVSAIGD